MGSSDLDTVEDPLGDDLQGVEGWLHLDEARALRDAVVALEPKDQPLLVVEIGSWKGRSTISLARGLQGGGHAGVILAVDPHEGNVEHRERWGAVDTYAEFLSNLGRAGVADLVRPIRATSHQARASVDNGSVSLLFVDGSHEYEDVLQDIDDWVSALSPGAVVVFNDSSWPGVFAALRRKVVRVGTPFRDPVLVRSTIFVTWDPTRRMGVGGCARWLIVGGLLWSRRSAHRYVGRVPAPIKAWANSLTNRLSRR